MKNAKWMLPVTLLLLSGLMAAQSLKQSTLIAQVPFDFMVSGKMIPAGECDIKAVDTNGLVLSVHNFDARKGALVSASRGEAGSNKTVLVFTHYGDRYFLSSIQIEGSNSSYKLPVSSAERELRAQNVTASQTTLLASLR